MIKENIDHHDDGDDVGGCACFSIFEDKLLCFNYFACQQSTNHQWVMLSVD
jgi:hypothetical protein